MKTFRQRFKAWGYFHLCFVFFVCCYSAYSKYCRYVKAKEIPVIKKVNAALFFNKAMLYYGKLSGTSTGYGFFAPNIKSNGLIIGDCDGKKIMPEFKSFEGAMRFSVLSSRVTDYLLTNDTTEIRDRSLKDKYYNLLFKSIAVKIYNQNNCIGDTAFVSYNVYQFTPLEFYRLGYRAQSLQKIKEIKLIKEDHETAYTAR